jgi:type II secretory pathway component PulF
MNKNTEKIYFYKRLSIMLAAGTPIVVAMLSISKASSQKKLANLFEKLAGNLGLGMSLLMLNYLARSAIM